jgi:hypothetical protein
LGWNGYCGSAFAGNELLISPDWLIEDGLVRAADCEGKSFSTSTIDYDLSASPRAVRAALV